MRDYAPEWSLERKMRELELGQDHLQRVLRLNPKPRTGERLRGLRLSGGPRTDSGFAVIHGYTTKGSFIRRFGRKAFDRLPSSDIVKRGKRVYIRAGW